MINHLTENIIEQYILHPESLTPEEKDYVETHSKECALCAEHLGQRANFLKSVDQNYFSQPTEREKEFFEKLTFRKRLFLPGRSKELKEKADSLIEGFAEVIEPYKRPLGERIVRYIRYHPVRTAISTVGFAVVLAALVFLVRPVKDTNIAYARAKDEFLIAYNKEGGELWRKHIGAGYDLDQLRLSEGEGYDQSNYLATIDLNGDSENEVVAVLGWDVSLPVRNKVFCFNGRGDTLWTYEFHRNMTFGKELFSDDYSVPTMVVGDFAGNGKITIIGIANHKVMYASSVFCLDASTGNFQSEYWHSGSLTDLIHADINHDGTEEIIAGGENNAYNQAALIIFNPRNIHGHSPALLDYIPTNSSAGEEEYYILFPRSDVQTIATKRNSVSSIVLREKRLEVRIFEEVKAPDCKLLYNFDPLMHCTSVEGQDQFVAYHKLMEKEGKLTQQITPEYYEKLRSGVQYWDGEKFVDTLTMNGDYTTTTVKK